MQLSWLAKKAIIPFMVLYSGFTFAALPEKMGAGIRGGVLLSFGSHVRQVGFTVSGYWYFDFIQLNALGRVGWHSGNIGQGTKGKEALMAIGAVAGFDPSGNIQNFFHSAISNQMGKSYSIALA